MHKGIVARLRRSCRLFSALAIIFFTGISLPALSLADSISAAFQYPVVEVKPLRGGKLPPALDLSGARNEYVFLHCRFPGADPGSFKIKLLEISRRAQPTKVSAAFYQLCSAPSASLGQLPPDALLPLEQGLIQTGNYLDLVVVIHISPEAPHGSFQYQLAASDKKQSFCQPVKVRIFNFYLPDDLPLPIFGGFWNYKPEHYAKYGVQSFNAYLETVKSYYSSMRRYKINALGGAYFFPFDELHPEKKIEDFQDYHQLLGYALNQLNYRWFMIPKLKGWQAINQPGSDFLTKANLFYPLYQEYLKRHGWQDRALNYLIDEPRPEYYPAVQQAFATSKSLAPAIKTLCAGWNPAPEFMQVIDIWATPATYYKESQANAARSQGQKQWLYANRLHGIDHPQVHQRLIGWIIHRYKFDGYLLWGVNYWPNDPWSTEPGAQDYMRRGTFYYPHPQTGQPVPTLRLESLRRGLQDYQYLQLLTEARRQGKIPPATFANIEQRVQALTANLQGSDFPVSMQEMESLRLQIGELLNGAGSGLGPVTPKDYQTPAPVRPSPKSGVLQDLLRYFFNRN